MPARITVKLGARHAAPVPTALARAIGQHLHPVQRAPRRAGGMAASALSLALLPAFAAQAATITVDSAAAATPVDGLCQLAEAVANANANSDTTAGECEPGDGLDTIVFDGSLAATNVVLNGALNVTDALAIDGAGAPDVVLTQSAPDRHISATADLSLSNLTLENGFLPAGGGGSVLAQSSLTVDNVEFSGNEVKYGDGGAILANGPLTVSNSRFYGNEAGKYEPGGPAIGHGGAIAAFDSLSISGSYLAGNEAYGAGGAVYTAAGGSITDSDFAYNRGYLGGAVFAGNPDGLLYEDTGKGVALPEAVVLGISGSDFTDNLASQASPSGSVPIVGMGGALAFMPESSGDGSLTHSLSITDSDFAGNAAFPEGGQQLQATAAKQSKYASMGGALAVVLAPTSDPQSLDALEVDLSGVEVLQNSALFGGGAIISASSVTVDASSFDQNAALVAGGAMLGAKYGKYAEGTTSTVLVTDSGFTNNAAYYIGGVLMGGTTLDASGLTVTGNLAGAYSGSQVRSAKGFGYLPELTCDADTGKYVGGALLSASDSLTLSGDNLFDGNCAGDVGGLLLESSGSASIGPGTVVSNNQALDPSGYAGGARIDAGDGGSVLFQGSVTGNTSAYDGGGLMLDAAATGTITVDAATISGNSAGRAGGGVLVYGSAGGAVTLSNSTLSGNSAGSGGGLYVAAPPAPTARAKGSVPNVSLSNVTVHGNDATAVVVAKGGFTAVSGTGGGVAVADGASLAASFATITGNTASDAGGGLWVGPLATATLYNSVVAGNTAPVGPDIAGSVPANFTFVGDDGGATVTGTGNDAPGGDPLLGPLQDNGGPTLTRAPLPGSPLLDSGDPGFAPPPAFDQRGSGFPRVVNGQVDRGAVEVALPAVIAVDITPAAIAEGAAGTLTVTLDAPAPSDVLATVDFTGVAVLGTDFTVVDADTGTAGIQVQVLAGNSSGSAALSALADAADEPDESLTASVSAASGATLAGPVQDTATILDGTAAPTVTLSLGALQIIEEGGSTTITATLSAPTFQDVTITLGFGGTATLGTDYAIPGTQIVIPAGSTSGSLVLSTLDDALVEGDETVVIDIVSVANATESGLQQGTVIIDDTADGTGSSAPPAIPQPTVIPTLSEWMLLLLGLLLPATVVSRLRRREAPAARRR